MGRGQQMSMNDFEKLSLSGIPGFRSVTKRRVVVAALVSLFLPFVLTSAYLYYTTPDAATEAMLFLQKRPFSSFSPVTVFMPLSHVHKSQFKLLIMESKLTVILYLNRKAQTPLRLSVAQAPLMQSKQKEMQRVGMLMLKRWTQVRVLH